MTGKCFIVLVTPSGDKVSSPKWEKIKQLLNPTTAAVYWHLSPTALHAFILKHDAPSPILITPSTQITGEELPAAVRRLRDFENWVKDWNQQYANYRKGKDKQVEAENNWRDNLPEMLQQLANILDIPTIVESIQNSIPPAPLKKVGLIHCEQINIAWESSDFSFLSMEKTLIDYLKTVEDHRALRGRRYPLWLMLLLVILGTLSDCQGYSALENFCVRHYADLCDRLGMTSNRLPSDSTFRRKLIAVRF